MNEEKSLEELAMTVPLEVGSDNDYLNSTEKEIDELKENPEKGYPKP